jgi:hypothetical protein
LIKFEKVFIKMKKLISSFFLAAISTLAYSQAATEDYYSLTPPKKTFKERISTSISMGGGLSFSKYGNAYTSYVAPKVSYQMNNKFKLNIGMMHYNISGNTFMPLNRTEALYNAGNRSASGNLVMVGGEYMLNKKVTVSGALMTDVNSMNKNKDPFRAASLGVEYKTSNNSTIKFETVIMQGQGNYFNSPASGVLNPMFSSSPAFSSDPNFWVR